MNERVYLVLILLFDCTVKLTLMIFIAEVLFVFEIAVFEVLLIFEVDETLSDDFDPESFFVLTGGKFLLRLLFILSPDSTFPLNLAILFFHIHKN